jgi:hypothetical protein
MILTCVCEGSAAGHVLHFLQMHAHSTEFESLPSIEMCISPLLALNVDVMARVIKSGYVLIDYRSLHDF